MRILLAVDGSAYSKAALGQVLDRPWPESSKFHVISVVEPFHPEYATWHANYVPLALEAQKGLTEAAESLVAETVESLQTRFGEENTSGEVLNGYIKDKILECAKNWQADLIVVGSHGKKGFTKFLLGSVSEAILSQAPCSVEIVKLPPGVQPDNQQESD